MPNPRFPLCASKRRVEVPADPKRTVEEACNPPFAHTAIVVVGARVVAPKFVVMFQSFCEVPRRPREEVAVRV